MVPGQHGFNMNDSVYVKLTDHGRKMLLDQHLKLYSHIKDPTGRNAPKWNDPTNPETGYARFQLWDLFDRFGGFGFLANNWIKYPFELNIRLEKVNP